MTLRETFLAEFNGPDYNPKHDKLRLRGQIRRVYNLMKDSKWRTLKEINQRWYKNVLLAYGFVECNHSGNSFWKLSKSHCDITFYKSGQIIIRGNKASEYKQWLKLIRLDETL